MRIESAILCDSATVREGLLHILGGGVTRMWRPELPAPLGIALALLIDMEREVEDVPHEVRLIISDPDGQPVGEAVAGIQYSGGARLEPGEHHLIPLVLPLHQVGTTKYGHHRIDVNIDGVSTREIRFWVLHPDEKVLPPIVE